MSRHPGFQLAELNIARARYENDDPRFQDFMDLLVPVNQAAERMPGFVWRFIDEGGIGSVDVQAFEDPRLLANLSVWADIESLHDFVYNTVHAKVMTRRQEWFDLIESQHLVLWWVREGHRPTLDEAKTRLETFNREGPSPLAFSFRERFDPAGVRTQADALRPA